MTYPDEIQYPHGLGPHEGIEFDLMLQGQKKVALFYDSTPDHGCIPYDQFAPFIETGQIHKMEFTHVPDDLPEPYINLKYVYYYVPDAKDDALRLQALNMKTQQGLWEEKDEYEIGRILGYEDWQIEAFLKHIRSVKTNRHSGEGQNPMDTGSSPA